MDSEQSQIQNFYKSCNVFITGGTGFMGKILLEKLLRSTDVSTIYILIREKKGKDANSRVDELFDDTIFDRLKKESPKYRNRIEPVPGDCTLSGLGLDIINRQKLASCVNIIFHLAATVRFNENLKLAYKINVNATREILELAKQTKNLKSFVYVSTAYSHCHRDYIDEQFYDCPISCDQISNVIEKISEEEAEAIEPRIIEPWPNTYCFTKALAEQFVKDYGKGLPMGVFRPSIVTSTSQEPIPGWIDNLYGPTGVVAGCMSGIVKVAVYGNCSADIVPVDNCVAGLIASAWDITNKKSERNPQDIPIYNYVSGAENVVSWEEFMRLSYIHGCMVPPSSTLWITNIASTSNMTLYMIYKLFYHIVPAIFVDIALVFMGNKPRMVSMYKKIHKFTDTLCFFATKQFNFKNDNMVGIWKNMGKKDRELFPVSITNVHWLAYFRTYILGVRRYLLKCPDDTIPAALKRYHRLKAIHIVTKITLIFLVCNLLWYLMSKFYQIIF